MKLREILKLVDNVTLVKLQLIIDGLDLDTTHYPNYLFERAEKYLDTEVKTIFAKEGVLVIDI